MSGKLKRTTKEVAKYFKSQGCELLDEYYGCMEPMDYKCSCGCYGTTTWNNFTKGKRCGQCTKYGQSKKRSLKEVQKIFQERGCEFLDDEFKGIHYKHKYRCKCGRECEITFAGFHHQNQLCRECGIKKMTGPGNPGWIEDRKQKRLDDLFRKRCYKALRSSLKATGRKKVGRTSDMLGYGPKELQEHIKKHPDWSELKEENWHIDHIFPLKAFLDYGIDDIALINSLDNLRPMAGKPNIAKGGRYNSVDFELWLESKEWEIVCS